MPKASSAGFLQGLWIGRAPGPDSDISQICRPGITEEWSGGTVCAPEDLWAARPLGDDAAPEVGGRGQVAAVPGADDQRVSPWISKTLPSDWCVHLLILLALTFVSDFPSAEGPACSTPGSDRDPFLVFRWRRLKFRGTKLWPVPNHLDDGRPQSSQRTMFYQNCDYRDMVGAVDEVNHWGSDLTPGKKRRRRRK